VSGRGRRSGGRGGRRDSAHPGRQDQTHGAQRRGARARGPRGAPALPDRARGDTTAAAPVGVVRGTLRVLQRGDAIVSADDPREAKLGDVFVARQDLGIALHGDRVDVQVYAAVAGEQRTGSILAVRHRSMRRVAGTVRRLGRDLFLDPDDPRVPGPIRLLADTQHAPAAGEDPTLAVNGGEVALAEIVRYPGEPTLPGGPAAWAPGPLPPLAGAAAGAHGPDVEAGGMTARVVRLLDRESLLAEEEALLALHGLPHRFPDQVAAAAHQVPSEVRDADRAGRADLTALDLVTIDPWDARDHDDAIAWVGTHGDVDRVAVAIADVSYYVPEGSPVDREARERANSVYFPDRVVPMLPEALSAGICSLVEGKDRLALVAELDIDATGKVVRAHFVDAVMRSPASLTYEQVHEVLEAEKGWQARAGRAADFAPGLRRLDDIGRRLLRFRVRRGAMDLDLPEAEILWDRATERVRGIRRRARSASHRLVEEMMLAANEAVARFFRRREAPVVYRIHEPPDPQKLLEFAEVAAALGHPFVVPDEIRPHHLAEMAERVEGKPEARSIHRMLLRAMKQARYELAAVGHFGLAAPTYLHFTSPIRRYPDLIVHRRLREELGWPYSILAPGGSGTGAAAGAAGTAGTRIVLPPARVQELAEAALHASWRERRSMDAERDVNDLYRCSAALAHLGEDREGLIATITSFGMFVEIDDPFLEGLVPIASLKGDYFEVAGNGARLVGTRTGYVFSLGDRVQVRIADVSLTRRRIELALLEHDPAERQGGGKERRGERHASHGGRGGGRGGAGSGGGGGRGVKPGKGGPGPRRRARGRPSG
jgi:ribonuclease R